MAKKHKFPTKPCPKCGKSIHARLQSHKACGWVMSENGKAGTSTAATKKPGRPKGKRAPSAKLTARCSERTSGSHPGVLFSYAPLTSFMKNKRWFCLQQKNPAELPASRSFNGAGTEKRPMSRRGLVCVAQSQTRPAAGQQERTSKEHGSQRKCTRKELLPWTTRIDGSTVAGRDQRRAGPNEVPPGDDRASTRGRTKAAVTTRTDALRQRTPSWP